MSRWSRLFLTLALTLAGTVGAPAGDAQAAAKPRPRAVAKAHPQAKAAVKSRWTQARAARLRVSRARAAARWRRAHPRRWSRWTPRQAGWTASSLRLGEVYIAVKGAPLTSRPGGGDVLARLPKRTIVLNRGRAGAYYKIEAPNGAIGYLGAHALSQTPGLDY